VAEIEGNRYFKELLQQRDQKVLMKDRIGAALVFQAG
jgi:hypothetical protein